MPDTVNDDDRDPPELGAILELLHRADAGFTTVQATYRIWRHDERSAAAFRANFDERKRRGVVIRAVPTSQRQSGAPEPVEHEEVLRIWREADPVREEHEGGRRDGAYGVRSGDYWWSWNPDMGAVSNEGDPNFGGGVGEQLSVMLDPTPLLGAMKFTAVGRSTIAGRATLTADATARPSDPRQELASIARDQLLGELSMHADHYRLEIDVERGVLLEAVAVHDGEPFYRITTVEVAFDHPIADERFHFEPPAGEQIQLKGNPPPPQRLSVPEAQQRAPFTVLIPDHIPANWHVYCFFIEASTRRRFRQPAQLTLHYGSDDGNESVSITEFATTNRLNAYEELLRGDAWHDVERDRTVVRVTEPDTFGPQAQAYLSERAPSCSSALRQ